MIFGPTFLFFCLFAPVAFSRPTNLLVEYKAPFFQDYNYVVAARGCPKLCESKNLVWTGTFVPSVGPHEPKMFCDCVNGFI